MQITLPQPNAPRRTSPPVHRGELQRRADGLTLRAFLAKVIGPRWFLSNTPRPALEQAGRKRITHRHYRLLRRAFLSGAQT